MADEYSNTVKMRRVPMTDAQEVATTPAPTPAPAPKRPWWDLRKQEKMGDALSKPDIIDKKIEGWDKGTTK